MRSLEWDFHPPRSAPIGDHDVVPTSAHLRGRRVALLVCGGIAAMRAPLVARALRRRGAEVVAFCSAEALHYVGRDALEWSTCNPLVTALTWRAEHLSDGAPFAAYLVAPATYNTLGKAASGVADTVVTAVLASALGRMERGATEVIFAPTMHGSMHHAVLERACRQLAAQGARFVTPRDAYGKHNLPDDDLLAAAVCRAVSRSPLSGRRVVVDGAAAPRLAAAVHEELLLRGADTTLLLAADGGQPAPWLPVTRVPSPAEARRRAEALRVEGDALVVVAGTAEAGSAVRAAVRLVEAPAAALRDAAEAALAHAERVVAATVDDHGAARADGPALVLAPGAERAAEGHAAAAAALADLLEGG